MKKLSFITLLLSFFIMSCQKQKEAFNDSHVNFNKVVEIASGKISYSQRVTVLSMLTDAEKAELWKTHFRKFVELNVLSAKQKSFISEMISTITPSLFNKDLEKENAGIIAKLEYRAKDIFPTNKYFVIFEAFNSTPEDLLTTQPQLSKAAPGGANCYCRSDSWCGSQVGSDLAVCL